MRGKVVLITGGSSGIGKAAAELFAKRGASVVIAARRTAEGETAAASIRASGGEASFVQADIGSPDDIKGMVETVARRHGRLDYALNNAASIDPLVPLAHTTEADWDPVIDVNLKGTWLCMKYEIILMLQSGGGAIVNTSSIIGVKPNEMYGPAYVASKCGMIGLTQLAALQYARRNIRVNVVCPGLIRTPMTAPYFVDIPGLEEAMVGWHPVSRIGEPHEVAEAAVWLCSDAASFITGQALSVDGGATAKFAEPAAVVAERQRAMP